ncbi:hypothetical protein [Piscinibacter gummiphilus]|uniref:Uncharacterized protein n=1 Tax=Piscinibacter gummiphilus TaxID=946333 RepID=A0A1W6L8W9_9BURK|nr:hypothetical protein [Piscinibacter gummiphilus]ARN20771.1 hypothetical protein A4W93_13175 [Piscinibacter gummiphilus]ATU65447.1 hypothetical protein CPZ87_13255 [Piscinibacter gummiphilus]GLS94601.1 hypothetical protein GCM10007918_18930 [Piscinibacter gummiphilus]
MSTEALNPPVSLVDDFKDLQMTIFQDRDGDKTRQLVAYFRQAEIKSREMQLRTTEYEQKQYAQMLADAFAASTRILLAAWQKAHGSDLHV